MKPAGPLLLRCGGAVGDIIIGDTPAQKLPLLLLLQLPLLLLSKLQRTGKLPLSVLRSGPGLDATAAAVESAALVMLAPNSGGADSTCTKLPLLQPVDAAAAAAGRLGLGRLTLLLAVAGCRSCCKPCAKKQNGLLQSRQQQQTHSMQRQQMQVTIYSTISALANQKSQESGKCAQLLSST
jgi:hypothetical protein